MNVASLILCVALAALPAWASQFVEIEASLEITQWRYQEDTGLALRNSQTSSVHCVVSTNVWLIETQSRANAVESTWFLHGKIIRLLTTTRDSFSEEPGYAPNRRGARTASILPAPDGYPGGEMIVNIPWFAFCSGTFLRHSTRGVPLPAAAPNRTAFGFTNETTFFSDDFGLPRRAGFYVNKQLKCDYAVQQTTNVLGWNFPVSFTVTRNEPDAFGKWNRDLTVTGRITSIRAAPEFTVPKELIDLLELREQAPVRRR